MWWRVLGADIRRRRGLTDFFHTSGFLQGVILASSGECSGSRLAIYYQCLHKWIGDIKHDSNFLPVYFFGYRYPQILINFIQSFKIAVTLYAFPELAFHINISQHRDMYPHSHHSQADFSPPRLAYNYAQSGLLGKGSMAPIVLAPFLSFLPSLFFAFLPVSINETLLLHLSTVHTRAI